MCCTGSWFDFCFSNVEFSSESRWILYVCSGYFAPPHPTRSITATFTLTSTTTNSSISISSPMVEETENPPPIISPPSAAESLFLGLAANPSPAVQALGGVGSNPFFQKARGAGIGLGFGVRRAGSFHSAHTRTSNVSTEDFASCVENASDLDSIDSTDRDRDRCKIPEEGPSDLHHDRAAADANANIDGDAASPSPSSLLSSTHAIAAAAAPRSSSRISMETIDDDNTSKSSESNSNSVNNNNTTMASKKSKKPTATTKAVNTKPKPLPVSVETKEAPVPSPEKAPVPPKTVEEPVAADADDKTEAKPMKVDAAELVYGKTKEILLWGKSVPVVSLFVGTSEAVAGKALGVVGSDLAEVDGKIETELTKFDTSVLNPAIEAVAKILIGVAGKSEDILKPVVGAIMGPIHKLLKSKADEANPEAHTENPEVTK